MEKNFKSIYLVCLDQDNDMNYVLARNPSLKKARSAAEKAKSQFPNDVVYITVEKVLKENPSITSSGLGMGYGFAANTDSKKCVCGRKKGGCISNLSCRCSAISPCKQMDTEESPFLMLAGEDNIDDELEEVEINIIRVSRNLIEVLIPDWADNSIGLSANEFPRDVLSKLEDGVVITAKINIDAASENDLVLKDIKLAYEDDEDDDEFDIAYDDDEDEDDDELDEDDEDEDDDELDEDEDEYGFEHDEENSDPMLKEPKTNPMPLNWSGPLQQEKALDFDEYEEDEFEEEDATSEY